MAEVGASATTRVATLRSSLATRLPGGSRVLGFGAAQPDGTRSDADLGRPFGKSGDWVRSRTGIRTLRRVDRPAEMGELVAAAAQDALRFADVRPDEIDLAILASCSVSSDGIGRGCAPRAAWVHLNAACSGFCYALQSADALVRSGAARHVLVVAAEWMSRMLDPDDLGTSIIFGDGAGAAVVGPADAPGIGPTVSGSDGDRAALIEWQAGPGGTLRMAGREVFRWAVEEVPGVAREACRRAGLALSDIDIVVPHQANLRITDAVVRSLDVEGAVVADDICVSGNTSAASVPLAVTHLLQTGRARTGQLALLLGFGAGMSYAAQVITLP